VLIYAVFLTAPCVAMLLWPRRQAQIVEQRIRDGDDRFFEEQRAYRAYPWMRDPKRIRTMGAVGTVCGLIFCALTVYRG